MNKQGNELFEYIPSLEHDGLLLQWWMRLVASGDISKCFMEDAKRLSRFYELLARPTRVTFKVDAGGIWFVGWFCPILAGATFDMWVAPQRRKSKAFVEAMCEALEWGFDRWPVLIGVTAQENLLDDHERMGYTVVGPIPDLWDKGKMAWTMYVTRDSFHARRTQIVRRSA